MKIYLLRHGEAEPGGSISDHDRALTAKGQLRVENAGRVLKQYGMKLTHLYSSPRVRARQTAEIIGAALGIAVEIREEVNFGFNVGAVTTLVGHLNDSDEVMFVGHNPTFSEVVQALTGANVAMKKGGLARIDLYDPQATTGELVWLIAPAIFDALAGA